MRICGVVVLYNPSIEVANNINSYINCIDELFVIDNSDVKNDNLLKKIHELREATVIDMKGNKGIAAALNVGLACACKKGYDFCLTMDQDSLFPFEKMKIIEQYLLMENVDDYGIIGLNFNSNDDISELIETDCWLTSGNFINIKNYKQISGFNSDLFIDYVDIELNEQFHSIGKKVAYIRNVSLIHTIGNPKTIKFLWFNITCMNHSPIRYYYRYRNGLFLYRKNRKFYRKKYFHDLIIDLLKVIIFEENKRIKIKMIRKGRKDAKNNILGKYNEIQSEVVR